MCITCESTKREPAIALGYWVERDMPRLEGPLHWNNTKDIAVIDNVHHIPEVLITHHPY